MQKKSSSEITKGLTAWVERLDDNEFPAMGPIVSELTSLTDDDRSSAHQLADVILKDGSLTTQVLRIANSVTFNPTDQAITTISRAVVQIGFNEIKAICLSVLIVQNFLGEFPRERLLESLGQSFHAAVQARNLAKKLPKAKQEEVFIAALLLNIAEIAFLGLDSPQVAEYDQLLKRNRSKKEAARHVLGVGFKTITKALVDRWELGGVIAEALDPHASPGPATQAALLGEAITRNIGEGLNSDTMQTLMKKAGKLMGTDEEQTKASVLDQCDEAASVAATFGAHDVCKYIPSSRTVLKNSEEPDPAEKVTRTEEQIRYLGLLTEMSMQQPDINRVFQTVVKGIFFGAGVARASIMLYDLQRTMVQPRYVYGEGTEDWRAGVSCPVSETKKPEDFFSLVLQKRARLWLVEKEQYEPLRSLYIRKILPVGDCFAAPLVVGNRTIGLLYADNDGKELSRDRFSTFELFAQQTNMILALMNA